MEYLSVLLNPVVHYRRSHSQLAYRILTDFIFPRLISRRRTYSVKMRMHWHAQHPTLHSSSLQVRTHFVAVRTRGGEDLGTMSVADFAQRLRNENHAA